MKRSRLSYDDWNSVVLKKEQQIKYIDSDFFQGYIGKNCIFEVSNPQIWRFNGEDITVCEKGYKWIVILPKKEHFCITAAFNPENQIVLWYIDMIAGQGLDYDGTPYFDDLYLDLIIYPDGSIYEDDRDELEEALEKGDITIEQFELANTVCSHLKSGLLADINTLIDYTARCESMLNNEQEPPACQT